MAAGEDQSQAIIGHASVVAVIAGSVGIGGEHGRLLELRGADRQPPHSVESPVPGRRGEPRTGGAWDAVAPPPLEGGREGVLRALLGEIPVAGDADEGGDDTTPLLAESGGDGGLDVDPYISQIGRTSTDPTAAPGIFDATSIASSRSLQSTR